MMMKDDDIGDDMSYTNCVHLGCGFDGLDR